MRRLTPRGPADLLRQLLLFCGAYWAYRLVRGAVVDRPETARENALDLVELERALGLYVEPAVHAWTAHVPGLMDVSAWLYVNSHFAVTTATLAFVYLCRTEAFNFVRNMFLAAMALALAGYLAYPTAPPRLLEGAGFSDPVAELAGVEHSGPLVNPYAAVPSMHVGFALMLAGTMWRLSRRRSVRAAWAVYPAVVTFVVIATANHWWMDAALGALAALLAAAAAAALARSRPAAWALPADHLRFPRPHGPPAPHHRA